MSHQKWEYAHICMQQGVQACFFSRSVRHLGSASLVLSQCRKQTNTFTLNEQFRVSSSPDLPGCSSFQAELQTVRASPSQELRVVKMTKLKQNSTETLSFLVSNIYHTWSWKMALKSLQLAQKKYHNVHRKLSNNSCNKIHFYTTHLCFQYQRCQD